MCLILFAYKMSSRYDLVLAANRDEFYSRPTAPMCLWPEADGLFAGKDLQQGGTWFGITRSGRFAALTNFRDPFAVRPDAPSRGQIVTQFLRSDIAPDQYGAHLKKKGAAYNGFNLIYGDRETLYCFSNVSFECRRVKPGIHGLSNRFFNTPWPKVRKGKKRLGRVLRNGASKPMLFDLLADTAVPGDTELPDTGIGLEWERILAPSFIQSPGYGTRSSTVFLIHSSGRMAVTERTYLPGDPDVFDEVQFTLPAPVV